MYDGWDPPRAGWTCAECGFDYDTTGTDELEDLVRGFGRKYRAPLTRGLPGEDLDSLLRRRPAPETWSALEYACHVRDVFGLYDWRIGRVLTEDDPVLPQMRRDDIVVEQAYNEQDPGAVAGEVDAAAGRLADRLAGVAGDAWDRAGHREGEALTVAWMGRNAVHEGRHHLLDIGRGLRSVRGR